MADEERDEDRAGGIVRKASRADDPLGIRRRAGRKRPPSFVNDADFVFDYKDAQTLRHFITPSLHGALDSFGSAIIHGYHNDAVDAGIERNSLGRSRLSRPSGLRDFGIGSYVTLL